MRFEQETRNPVFDYLGDSVDPRRDDRFGAAMRLRQRQGQSFFQRGQNDEIARSDPVRRIGAKAEKPDSVGNAAGARMLLHHQPICAVSLEILSQHQKQCSGPASQYQPRRVQEVPVAFALADRADDGDDLRGHFNFERAPQLPDILRRAVTHCVNGILNSHDGHRLQTGQPCIVQLPAHVFAAGDQHIRPYLQCPAQRPVIRWKLQMTDAANSGHAGRDTRMPVAEAVVGMQQANSFPAVEPAQPPDELQRSQRTPGKRCLERYHDVWHTSCAQLVLHRSVRRQDGDRPEAIAIQMVEQTQQGPIATRNLRGVVDVQDRYGCCRRDCPQGATTPRPLSLRVIGITISAQLYVMSLFSDMLFLTRPES